MTRTISYRFEYAVAYFNAPEQPFGTGANVSITVELTSSTSFSKNSLGSILQPLDHKHLHKESPDWKNPNEAFSYGLPRVLQATLFLLRQKPGLSRDLLSVQIEAGDGRVLLFK